MKFIVNLPEELKNANLTVSKDIPVSVNFGNEKIGIADIDIKNMTAELNIEEKFSKEILNKMQLNVGGKVIERDGNIINKFDIKEVSFSVNM